MVTVNSTSVSSNDRGREPACRRFGGIFPVRNRSGNGPSGKAAGNLEKTEYSASFQVLALSVGKRLHHRLETVTFFGSSAFGGTETAAGSAGSELDPVEARPLASVGRSFSASARSK